MKSLSKEIGIDLGTSYTRISVRGRGTVLSEPTVVAINKITGEILAVGNQAREMLGRTPDSIVAVKPLKDGIIADFEATRMLIQNLVYRVVPKSLFYKPKMVITIPSSITDVEERAVEGVGYKAGAKAVYLMEEVMAAAIGAGLPIDRPEGCMIVDIGGGTTEVAVISLGGIVVSDSIRVAGDTMDDEIINYIKNNLNLAVGSTTAEQVKLELGCAITLVTQKSMEIRGRELTTGLPENKIVTSEQVQEAMAPSIEKIIDLVKATLEKTPPELASDIIERGIVLTGGGALIKGIDTLISQKIEIPVYVADRPLDCVANGTGKTIEDMDKLRTALIRNRRR